MQRRVPHGQLRFRFRSSGRWLGRRTPGSTTTLLRRIGSRNGFLPGPLLQNNSRPPCPGGGRGGGEGGRVEEEAPKGLRKVTGDSSSLRVIKSEKSGSTLGITVIGDWSLTGTLLVLSPDNSL